MTGALPVWIQRLLGIESPESGEGTLWALEHSWDWPAWLTLLFVLFTLVYVGWIYRREGGSAGRLSRILLASLRVVAIALVTLMLAQWALSLKRTGLPHLVLAIDDSASMATVDRYQEKDVQSAVRQLLERAELDEGSRMNLAKALLLEDDANLIAALRRRYNLKLYLISEDARPSAALEGDSPGQLREVEPSGAASRLGQGVQTILNDFRGNPPAAIVLFTDGIVTDGPGLFDAAEAARRSAVPIVTIGLGDPLPTRDLKLADVVVDDVAFVGDVLHFDATISASGYAGHSTRLTLRKDGEDEVLASVPVTMPADGESQKVAVMHRPEATDDFDFVDYDFQISLEPDAKETQTSNNHLKRRVRIYNRQIQVLLVQGYRNYEFHYLKQLLERDKTIRLHTVLQDADVEYPTFDPTALPMFPVRREELFEYDLVIFGDVDPSLLGQNVLQNMQDFVMERGGSAIFIAGPRFMPLAYRETPLATLFPFELDSVRLPDPEENQDAGFTASPTELGLASPQLQIGDGQQDSLEQWSDLAPLYWMIETPRLKPAGRVLVEHPTRTGESGNLPLISLQYAGAGKVVFHSTDETWRWRKLVGDAYFGRYWVQTVRFLSRTKLGQQGNVELTTDRREYNFGEPVRLRARFYDEQLAPSGDDGVVVMAEAAGQRKQQVTLHRSGVARGTFEGTVANLAPGGYHLWVLEPSLEADASADFTVAPPQGEATGLRPDMEGLKLAARSSRGHFYTVDTADRLLHELPRGRQVPIDSLPPQPLWNRWPVLLLLLGVLSAEWFLRKRNGML